MSDAFRRLPLRCCAVAAAGARRQRVRRRTTPDARQQQQRQLDAAAQQRAGVARGALGRRRNYTSIPGRETNVLIQPRTSGQDAGAGEAWRQFRNGPITFYGGWLVVLVLVAIAAFYFANGPVKLHEQPTGPADPSASRRRAAASHWSMAISFCVARHLGPDHAVRQARAAAAHRLHAVLVAHRARARTCTTSSGRCSSSRCSP